VKNKFRLVSGSLIVAVILTFGISGAVFADPGDEDGYFDSGYCPYHSVSTGNSGYATSPRYRRWVLPLTTVTSS